MAVLGAEGVCGFPNRVNVCLGNCGRFGQFDRSAGVPFALGPLAQTAKQQTRQGAGMPNLLEPLREAKLSCGSRDRAARTQQTGRDRHLK